MNNPPQLMSLPSLDGNPTPQRRGVIARIPLTSRILPGIGVTRAQIEPWAWAWQRSNRADWDREGPLWVLIGDSTAQGIGARSWQGGYAGQLRHLLDAETGESWRLLNLSRSGDHAEDALHNQVPLLLKLPEPPRLVTAIVGANNIFRTPPSSLVKTLTAIFEALPAGSVVGTLPQGLRNARARQVNDDIVTRAARLGLCVADIWTASGPPWRGNVAVDQFHPNERGYTLWANAIAAAAGLDGRLEVPRVS